MKKILLFLFTILTSSNITAQIRQYEDLYKEVIEEPENMIKPYNYDQRPYDSLSNHLSRYSGIIGQEIYYKEKSTFYLNHYKQEQTKKVFLISSINSEAKSPASLDFLRTTTTAIDVTLLSNKATFSNAYFKIIDILMPGSDKHSEITSMKSEKTNNGLYISDLPRSKLVLNNQGRFSTKSGNDRSTSPSNKLVLNEQGELSTYEVEKFNGKKSGERIYYNRNMHYSWRVNYTPYSISEPIIVEEIQPLPKDKPLFVLVEKETKDTLLTTDILENSLCVGYYDKLVELHKGKMFSIYTYGYEHSTKPKSVMATNRLKNNDNSYSEVELFKDKEYLCEDVVMYNGLLVGVFSNNNTKFALSMTPPYLSEDEFFDVYTYQSVHNGIPDNMLYKEDEPFTYTSFRNIHHSTDFVTVEYIKELEKYKENVRNHTKEYLAREEEERIAANKAWQKAYETEKAKELENLIQRYGSKFGKLVADRDVVVGMNKAMCRDAWGTPIRTLSSEGADVWYYYSYFDDSMRYVVFYNNKATEVFK